MSAHLVESVGLELHHSKDGPLPEHLDDIGLSRDCDKDFPVWTFDFSLSVVLARVLCDLSRKVAITLTAS